MIFKLIVFDWDGTLMDSEARIVACMQAAFADTGRPVPSSDRVRNIIGLGLDQAVRRLAPAMIEQHRLAVIDRYRHHYLMESGVGSPLFSGARETLETLVEQGYLLGVATGKGRRGLNQALADTGLSELFHATRCADEAPSKPHPEMLLQIIAQLGVAPEETLMIGDTEYDLEMARSAGARALAVCYGVHSRERLMKQRPLDCLDQVGRIPGWLGTFAPPLATKAE